MDNRRGPRLSLDLLKGFEAAARHLSFTRAAHELSLTQSAVSHQIRTLEEQLGQPLFSRVNRALRLTDAGQALFRAVGGALQLIDEATARIAVSQIGERLAITTTVPLASVWLVPKLPRFIQMHPEVDVRSVAANQSLDLEREGLDLAIRWLPPGSSAPDAEPLFDVEFFPVCSPALARDRARALKRPTDLEHHVLLELETASLRGPWSDWRPWLDAMNLSELKPAGTLRFSHYDQVLQAAIDSSGVAIGRSPHNIRHLVDGLLVAPFGPEAVLRRGAFFVLVARRSAERRVVKEFVAWLRDEVRQEAAQRAERER